MPTTKSFLKCFLSNAEDGTQGIVWGSSEPNDVNAWASEFNSDSRETLEEHSD
jgi:hypothetical protein